jgi:hypothetical protein
VTLTLSPPVRIAALLGLVAALTIGASFMVLSRKSQEAPVSDFVEHPTSLKNAPAPPVTAKRQTAAAKPQTKPAALAKAAPVAVRPVHRVRQKPAAEKAALAAGLPGSLARALGQHAVVVAALYNPESQVDGIAFAEAQAGAALAGAGFVPLNVLSQADVGTLTQQLGVLPDPGFLVYTARDTRLTVRIDGFADKETVAQAAQNARQGS